MINRTRKTTKRLAEEVYFLGQPLAVTIRELQQLAEKYSDNAIIDREDIDDDHTLYVYTLHSESDDEMADRIKVEEFLENERALYQQSLDEQEYERLALKLGKISIISS